MGKLVQLVADNAAGMLAAYVDQLEPRHVSQRLDPAPGPVTLSMNARAAVPVLTDSRGKDVDSDLD
ncbi:MAG: hypothetical protein ACRDNK_02570 [Solirubrobacteraceae bacterium]